MFFCDYLWLLAITTNIPKTILNAEKIENLFHPNWNEVSYQFDNYTGIVALSQTISNYCVAVLPNNIVLFHFN